MPEKLSIASYIEKPFEFDKELSLLFDSHDELIIFDIGACEGEDSIRFERRLPNAQIYTFEPLPKNIERITANFNQYNTRHCSLFPVALSNQNGTADFYVSSGRPPSASNEQWDYGNKSSSLLAPAKTREVHQWLEFKEKVEVKTQRLDNFVAEHKIHRVDFAYMDVQGAEMMVLEGAGDFINHIQAIWLEVEAVELYAKQPLRRDIELFMRQKGFIRIKDTVDSISGDQLYINRELFESKKHLLNKSWAARVASILKGLHP